MSRSLDQRDIESFQITKTIEATRTSEYWLLFFNNYVLKNKKWRFKFYHLFFLFPTVLLPVVYLKTKDTGLVFGLLMAMLFISFAIFVFTKQYIKKDFIPVNEFSNLAKFIVQIKGDIYKNSIKLRLNSNPIEKKENLLKLADIGLVNDYSRNYKPYQLERFFSQFRLKDGSHCKVSLHQMSIRIIKHGKSRSGKAKVKVKHKHYSIYQLTLKLKASKYVAPNHFDDANFEIRIKQDSEHIFLKAKLKHKVGKIDKKIKISEKHEASVFTQILTFLKDEKIVVSETN